jgi:hypothetical protein
MTVSPWARLAPDGRLVFLWALPQTLSKKQGQHAATDGAALARRPPPRGPGPLPRVQDFPIFLLHRDFLIFLLHRDFLIF